MSDKNPLKSVGDARRLIMAINPHVVTGHLDSKAFTGRVTGINRAVQEDCEGDNPPSMAETPSKSLLGPKALKQVRSLHGWANRELSERKVRARV